MFIQTITNKFLYILYHETIFHFHLKNVVSKFYKFKYVTMTLLYINRTYIISTHHNFSGSFYLCISANSINIYLALGWRQFLKKSTNSNTKKHMFQFVMIHVSFLSLLIICHDCCRKWGKRFQQ